MGTAIYWALKLDESSVNRLLSLFPPKHKNVYAEHITMAFKPSDDVKKILTPMLGLDLIVKAIGYAEDINGQAVVVSGVSRFDGGIPHVTISCAAGITPVYSNKLLSSGFKHINEVDLTGTIGYVDSNKNWNFK